MDLVEYQGHTLFSQYGLPVLPAGVARTPKEARAIAAELGGRVVIKAQVTTGGRGKAGGVRLAEDPHTAESTAEQMLGTSVRGHRVESVMVTRAVEIAEEYYFSYLVDRASNSLACVASATGGVDIESVAGETPSQIVRTTIRSDRGVDEALARDIVTAARFSPAVTEQIVSLAMRLWEVFVSEDATLVEVNPLARTADGMMWCLDAKVVVDDNALFRHPTLAGARSTSMLDPVERLARDRDLTYVKLDGQVGVIGNGAGLVMSTLDVLADAGAPFGVGPANFLDIGGGANASVMASALDTVLSDPAVRCVLINIFGGITACDVVADGVLSALAAVSGPGQSPAGGTGSLPPVVVRLDGHRSDEGRRMIDTANHPRLERVDTMDAAARRAAELASLAGV